MKTASLLLAAVLPAFTLPTAATDTASELFQKALVEEEANRNLEAAVRAYTEVVKRLDEQRHLAATAVFRLGECSRKLGQTNEAVAAYERVLREFAGEETLAKLSQQNLAALGHGVKTVTGVMSDHAFAGSLSGQPSATENITALANRLADLEDRILQTEDLLKRWDSTEPDKLPGLLIESAGAAPELQALVTKRDDMLAQMAAVTDLGAEHPQVVGQRRALDVVGKRIAEKVQAVVNNRRMQLDIDKKSAERLRARLASRDSGSPSTGTDAGATEHRQLAAQLAEIEKLPAGSDERANAVLAFFPDDALKRMLLHLPKVVQQRDEIKADPTAKRSVTYSPIDADGAVGVSVQTDGLLAFAEGALKAQRDAITQREDFLLGVQRARLKVLERIVAAQNPGSASESRPRSPAAREAQRQLLVEEIKLIEGQVAEAKKRVELGLIAPLEGQKAQRDLLAKQRELLALDDGTIEQQRGLLAEELRLVDYQVQATQAMFQNGKASKEELVKVKREALQLRQKLVELENPPAARPAAAQPGLSSAKAVFFGEVRGVIPLPPGEKMTLADGLLRLGWTDVADLKHVRIYRWDAGKNTGSTLTNNLENVLRRNERAEDVVLQDGDRVEVPARKIVF